MRDDFSEETKRALAKRAGYHCSFPGCGSLTIGPSSESSHSTSSIGVAAHIAAASGGIGARRYDSAMTPIQRKDISNGIWMCEKHAKLIDTDETRFSIAILNRWKEIAEDAAAVMVEKSCSYEVALTLISQKTFAQNIISIKGFSNAGLENERIGNALDDSCIPIFWGENLTHALRDYIIEHLRNSFIHGKASEYVLEITDTKITLSDNGNDFNPRSLLTINAISGGILSLEHLLSSYSDKIVFASERILETNKTTISILTKADDIFNITPCVVKVDSSDLYMGDPLIQVNETCKEIYVLLPKYFAVSEAIRIKKAIPELKNHASHIIFIADKVSNQVKEIIAKNYPESHLITIT